MSVCVPCQDFLESGQHRHRLQRGRGGPGDRGPVCPGGGGEGGGGVTLAEITVQILTEAPHFLTVIGSFLHSQDLITATITSGNHTITDKYQLLQSCPFYYKVVTGV